MAAPDPTRTLYLCYFGLREPLVQTQVLPYLRQIGAAGIQASLLTFEPVPPPAWRDGEAGAWMDQLAAQGIRWHWLRYHKRPSLPATLYDIAAGALYTLRLVRREGVSVLHARSHVAAAIGALARRVAGGSLIFDIRGLAAEEYVDAGRWSKGGLSYRLTKRVEKWLLASADGFVVLTERAREILFPGCTDTDQQGRPVEVIPCCVDLERFRSAETVSREQVRRELGLSDRRVIVYTGALGGWYLTEEMADFLSVAHQQDRSTFSMILTQSPPEGIAGPMRQRGIDANDFLVLRLPPPEVPRYLRAADLAISFIKPCYSKLASSPTKLAEYLAGGLPVLCNAGIGDVDEVIQTDRVGVLFHEFHREAYLRALEGMEILRRERGLAERCCASARERFDLVAVGGARYRRLYHRLLAKEAGELAASSVVR